MHILLAFGVIAAISGEIIALTALCGDSPVGADDFPDVPSGGNLNVPFDRARNGVRLGDVARIDDSMAQNRARLMAYLEERARRAEQAFSLGEQGSNSNQASSSVEPGSSAKEGTSEGAKSND